MSSRTLDELLTSGDRALLEAVLDADETNFVQLGKMLNLNKKTAWRFLNLSECNFSNCDLRGFDFTGADLRGCTGSNVLTDETTVFAGADVRSSIFALDLRVAAILEQNPDLRKEYTRIRRAYWSDQHEWVADILTRPAKDAQARRSLAMALFFETSDATVRSTILQFLVLGSSDNAARFDFFSRAISEPAMNPAVFAGAIFTFGAFYRNDEHVLLLLLSLAEDDRLSADVCERALKAALQNRHFIRHQKRILGLVRHLNSSAAENSYLRALAATIGPAHLAIVSGGRLYGGVDFRPITVEAVHALASGLLEAQRREIANSKEGKPTTFPAVYERSAWPGVIAFLLKDLVRRGLPIDLDFEVETAGT